MGHDLFVASYKIGGGNSVRSFSFVCRFVFHWLRCYEPALPLEEMNVCQYSGPVFGGGTSVAFSYSAVLFSLGALLVLRTRPAKSLN